MARVGGLGPCSGGVMTLVALIPCPVCHGEAVVPVALGVFEDCGNCTGGYVPDWQHPLTEYVPGEPLAACGLPLRLHPAREDCGYVP